ncbi:MAG TPA: protein kinase, partial [Bdellovibrionota bacterium]|nr:protein kinase [Bdellovibrionota bacterium]
MNEAGTVESREREAEWIGPYRVIGVLRRGVTFHVASESGNSSFVLKRPDGISRRKIRKRVSRLTSIQQPSLARVMGLLEEDGIVYTWREFIPGTPLSIVIRTLAAGDAFAATSKLLQIADGLSALHDKGMAHGNLHPGNLILSNEGRLVIVDSPESAFPPAWWPKMNDSRAIYLSPEQLRGYRPTPRSDLFAAGVIYHELCYGRYPFPGEGWLNEIRAIWSAEPADEIYKIMGATPKVRRVLQRLLQKRPVRRYASASELLEALDGPKRVRTAGWPRFRTPFRALRASVQTGADFALTPFSRLPVAKLVAAGTLLSAFIFGISLL